MKVGHDNIPNPMTKRDHFAAAAMQAILCNSRGDNKDGEEIAAIAVEMADCMLRQLEKNTPLKSER